MARFLADIRQRYPLRGDDYAALHEWSITRPEAFWTEIWHAVDIIGDPGAGPVRVPGVRLQDSRWFPEASLNFAENLLHRRDDAIALLCRDEDGATTSIRYRELFRQVEVFATKLQSAGIVAHDVVAGYLPNRAEAVVAMLAAASLGAIWTCCAADFGAAAVIDRLAQTRPKVLIAGDGYRYKGRMFDNRESISAILRAVDSIRTVYRVTVIDAEEFTTPGVQVRVSAFDAPLSGGIRALAFERFPFDHPLYILYSSGTTGAPKCIVHGAGGTLLQHAKELRLHVDLTHEGRLFYFTTTGWMMWNWLVSGLSCGATLVLYDGAPNHPAPDSLMDLVDDLSVSVFGTSARYLDGLRQARYTPRSEGAFASLRTLLSTGSPLIAESFDYVYQHVKGDLLLASISGGTDIVSCFVLGNPLLPVHRGEIQCKGLGMAVEVWREDGTPAPVNEKGELVCTRPFPSMPLGFWGDDTGERYHDAYFSRYPGVWTQGDFAEITDNAGLILHGRSDTVLNPGGVRIGTAEIYRHVEALDWVEDSICVGRDLDGDVSVVLFVVVEGDRELTEERMQQLRSTLRRNASPRHVPAEIHRVRGIPRTRNGKKCESAVRDLVNGRSVSHVASIENPATLDDFHALYARGRQSP